MSLLAKVCVIVKQICAILRSNACLVEGKRCECSELCIILANAQDKSGINRYLCGILLSSGGTRLNLAKKHENVPPVQLCNAERPAVMGRKGINLIGLYTDKP
jgi:hypothetical protein